MKDVVQYLSCSAGIYRVEDRCSSVRRHDASIVARSPPPPGGTRQEEP